MDSRFYFHAHAVGAAANIRFPLEEVIEVQAASALPEAGGTASSRVEKFRRRDIISFDAAYTEVTGYLHPEKNLYYTTATATVENFNLLNVVTADKIVARITTTHTIDSEAEPSVLPVGSHFENLRIAGHKVDVDLAVDTFAKFDTAGKVRGAFGDGGEFRQLFSRLSQFGKRAELSERIARYFPYCDVSDPNQIPESKGIIRCSLARTVDLSGAELRPVGHVVHVPNFGVVRLAEFQIRNHSRRLTMLRVDLGSPTEGDSTASDVEGNGSWWP